MGGEREKEPWWKSFVSCFSTSFDRKMLVAALINGTKVCVCVFSCTSHTEYQNSPGILVGVEVGATVGVWVDNASRQ